MLHVFKSVLLATSLVLAVQTYAAADENHKLADIVGDGIAMKYNDHAAAGSIAELPVYFAPKADAFGADIIVRHAGVSHKGELRKDGTQVVGDIAIAGQEGQPERKVVFLLNKADAQAKQIDFTLNGKAGQVKIISDEVVNGHFQNPEYVITLGTKEFRFRLVGGEACIGCSVRLTFGVLTALAVKDPTL